MELKRINRNFQPVIFYIVFFLFILASSTLATNYDLDFWARLIVGKFVIQTGNVPVQDFLSYTPTHACFDHEWGSGVIFYLIQHFFSYQGILFLQVILTFLIFRFIIKIVKLRGVKTTSEYNFLFYYCAFVSFSYIVDMPVRCQMFSFLFFTIFLYLLERARSGIGKNYELLVFPPLIMIFWYNLHGGCIIGVGLISLYIIGELINRRPIDDIKRYIYSLLLCIAVFPINPWGIKYFYLVVSSNFEPRPLIAEWSGIFAGHSLNYYLKFKLWALILLSIEFILILKQIITKTFKFDATKFLVIFITLFFAIIHIKLIPFAVITMSCFLYDDFYTVFNAITHEFFNKISIFKDIIVYLFILIYIFANIRTRGFGPYLNFKRFPVKSVEFIKINNLKGNILQDFSFGSYISYKLYPQNKIFMDGRFDTVYDSYMLPMLGYFHTGLKNWDEVLKLFPPDIILLEKYQAVYFILLKHPDWKPVFQDEQFAVFVRTNNVKRYKMPSDDLNYYKKTLFNTDIDFGDKRWLKK